LVSKGCKELQVPLVYKVEKEVKDHEVSKVKMVLKDLPVK